MGFRIEEQEVLGGLGDVGIGHADLFVRSSTAEGTGV